MVKTNNVISISEGYSLNYLVPAIFLFAVSIPFLVFKWPIAIPFIVIGFILIKFKTGLKIDIENQTALSYKSIFGWTFGEKKSVNNFSDTYLVFTHDVDKDDLDSDMEMGSMFQAKTYDLFVKNEFGYLHLHEFVDYELAYKAMMVLADNFNMDFYDPIEEMKKSILKRKRK